MLRRDDLAAAIAGYRTQSRRPREWFLATTGIGALFIAVLLISVGGRLGWPDRLDPVFLAGGWAGLVGSFVIVRRRERKLRDRYQILCPACHQALLDESVNRAGEVPWAELTLASGNCPGCGTHILAP